MKVQPKNKSELKDIIEETIKEQGFDCDLNFIDTSAITDMSELFRESKFNGDISKWDVSNVKTMDYMFKGCENLDCDLSKWNISNVVDTTNMFYGCTSLKNKPSWYKE